MHYRSQEKTLIYRLRGTNQQTDTALLHVNGSVSGQPGHPVRRVQGYQVAYTKLQNRSGATISAGFGVRIPNWLWQAGALSAAGAYTDDTADAQSTTADSFALETTGNNSGFIVVSDVLFNAISFNVTTASVDATNPARAVSYSDGEGNFDAVGANDSFVQDGAADEYALGENLIVVGPMEPWKKTTGAEATGIPVGKYALRVQATTAPDTTAALAGGMEIWRLYGLEEGITDNGVRIYEAGIDFSMPYGDALGCFISSIAATGSIATILFSPGGAFGNAS